MNRILEALGLISLGALIVIALLVMAFFVIVGQHPFGG